MVKIIVIEGTPEELQSIQQLRQLLESHAPVASASTNGAEPSTQREPVVTADMVYRALVAPPLNVNQRRIIDAVVEASPGKVDIASLQARLPGVRNIGGVIGGLGLRFKGTRGWPRRRDTGIRPSRHVLIRERDPNSHVTTYRASPELVQAWQRFNAAAA